MMFEMHAIVPKKNVFDSKRVSMMVLNSMKTVGKWMKEDLVSTTEYWVHKPDFISVLRYKGGDPRIIVELAGTNISNTYWKFVNYGTLRRRVIFDAEYQPKTSYPGSFYSNTPGKYTTRDWVQGSDGKWHSKIVGYTKYYKPGIRPRRWIGTTGDPGLLERTYTSIFQDMIDSAIERGMQPK